MRLIHEVIEDLPGRPDEDGTPLGAALEELLGGERGSLPDLADRFTEAGLADGPNLAISTSDLRRVLGEERAEDLATLAGLDSEAFLVHLARLLPAAVHHMAPEGDLEMPDVARRPRHG